MPEGIIKGRLQTAKQCAARTPSTAVYAGCARSAKLRRTAGNYCAGQGMIGTELMLFCGLPSMTRSL